MGKKNHNVSQSGSLTLGCFCASGNSHFVMGATSVQADEVSATTEVQSSLR